MKVASGPLNISLMSSSPAETKLSSETKPIQYEINIPIGASIHADCYITEDAAFPSVILKNIFDNIGTLPNIELRKIKDIEAGVMKNLPYIYLEAEYVTKNKLYGIAKMIASSTMDVSFYCSHDELGYKQSFFDAVRTVAESRYLQGFIKERSDYRKKQIDIMYLNDMSVGYAEHYQIDIEGNNKRDISFSSTLIPRSTDAIFTNDSVDYSTYSSKTGYILEGEYYSYTNDEPDYELELIKGTKDDYSIKGIFHGKKVEESFSTGKDLLYSGYVVDLYIQNKTEKEKWTFEEYVPLSPLGPTTSSIELKNKKENGGKTIEYSFAGVKATVELDEHSYSTMDMGFGNASFKMVRKYLDVK